MSALPQNSSPSPFLKQDGAATKSNAIDIPSITLPKGGGALKGIDEKFSVNAFNGTGSFSIPLPVSPSRGGFQPSLSLSYNSGGGNNIFGLGWEVGFPSIQRKTDRKLPTYHDRDEGDVFLFSGAEDLVPVTSHPTSQQGNFEIEAYRPRIEGLFARIEKVIPSTNKKKFYWKITTKENVVTFFGISDACRISDPQDDTRIYQWLPEISFDDKGNFMHFIYKHEDKMNIYASLHEQHRIDGTAPFTNRYLKRIKYGNKSPFFPGYVVDPSNANALYESPTPPTEFMFEIVFDYGEHIDDSAAETTFWKARKDAFSNYKPGFEIRTYRLCERVMVFHKFSELNSGIQTLVRSLEMKYDQSEDPLLPVEVTYLTEIRQKGYTRKAGMTYSESLPPLSFEYQRLKWNKKVHHINKEDLTHAPTGLSGDYQWTDFYNEGIPGILTEQANAWYYKSNLGQGHFSQAQLVSPKPSFTGIQTGALQLMDLDANGRNQIVSYQQGLSGYFELTSENDWLPFREFEQMPSIDMNDPNTRLIDLNGDGKPELVITEEFAFRWYPSNGAAGYDSPEMAPKSYDEEKGPAILFADNTQSIYLADMSGDGLTDIVRIDNNGSVCYWPNKGYGHFAAKVNMGSIEITEPFSFNRAYLQLADVSGTGSTDIIYLGNNKWQVWINKSGNTFSAPCEIDAFWQAARPGQIDIVDLLGNGTSCIVWSSPLPDDARSPMKYIDLMGGHKPHIIVSHRNNMGKTTRVDYKSSTQYYLEDKKAGTPWVTKLPFPVHCISRVEVIDEVTDLHFITTYSYHHGYYDHIEKEFRGFGRVDQLDTEDYQYLKNKGASNATDIKFHEPPVLTRTWTHTGAFVQSNKVLHQFEKEYWYNNHAFTASITEHSLNDAELPAGLTMPEKIEAYRACKGMILRSETFALDGSVKEKIPYSVVTHNCIIRMLQARGSNQHAIFLVHESESITFSYERKISDPRIAHSLNLEIDQYGNVLKSVSVVYGRKADEADRAINDLEIIKRFTNTVQKQDHVNFLKRAQTQRHVIYTETKVTTDQEEIIDGKKLKYYRLPQPWSVRSFEVSNISTLNPYLGLSDFAPILSANVAIKSYHETFDQQSTQIQLRLIEHMQTLLLGSDLESPLPAGRHGAMGMTYESYQLAFTPALIDLLFNIQQQGSFVNPKRVTDSELVLAKYCHIDHDPNDLDWWIRSGTIKYFDRTKNETRVSSANRYYVPIMYTDPFGATTQVEYPANNYFLYIGKTIDALGNESGIVDFDYRVLAPGKMRDMNDNLSEVRFNALGLVAGMAVMGKGNQADDMNSFIPDLTDIEVETFFSDPFLKGKDLLKNATARMVYDWKSIPVKVASISRETHVRNESGGMNPESKLQYSFEYTGGMGNSVLKKVRTENGKAKKIENGVIIETNADPRWIGNGRTILNNKGKPVKQYEPYFSTTHLYESEPSLREFGVTPILHYDPAGRMVQIDYPDGTFSRVKFDSWQQSTFDQNDTIKESKWATLRGHVNDFIITSDEATGFLNKLEAVGGDIAQERKALAKSIIHAATPSVVLTDSLGRPFYNINHNAWKFTSVTDPQPAPVVEFSATRLVLDIEGNTRMVIDARGNTVMKYDFDMLGHTMHSISMDAGERWLLNDSLGKPICAWDERNHTFKHYYDALHRPLYSHVVGGDGVTSPGNGTTSLQHVFDRFIYGETEVNAKAKNVRGKPIRHYDTGGVVETPEYDFKGQPKSTTRRLFSKYREVANWIDSNLLTDLESETFTFKAETDALGRIITQTAPDRSVIKPSYNVAGLLNGESVEHFNPGAVTEYITDINYNEKGQRNYISYGNGIKTTFDYDKETFRLARLKSNHNNKVLQDLFYTYDPAGNITFIRDDAHDPEFFSNRIVEPVSSYTYDALYRLIEATGRENSAALTFGNNDNWEDLPFIQDNPMSVKVYTQRYQYDLVGNIREMNHDATGNPWKRMYEYEQTNNRLKTTKIGSHQYNYPHHGQHGFITSMPHLQIMDWNFKEELIKTARQKVIVGNGTAETTYYQYDGQGQRIRKITENSAHYAATPSKKDERIYISGYEVYKKHSGTHIGLERTTLSLMDGGHRFVMVETRNHVNDGTDKRLVRYQLHNHLGSSALEMDNTARVISYEEYHPYGTTAYQSKNKLIKCAAKRYRYTGMERDEETGLEYHSARYYLPWLGRWLNCDPIGIGDGVNVYLYAKNGPMTFNDISGSQADIPSYNPNSGLSYDKWFNGLTQRDRAMVTSTARTGGIRPPQNSNEVAVFQEKTSDDRWRDLEKQQTVTYNSSAPPEQRTTIKQMDNYDEAQMRKKLKLVNDGLAVTKAASKEVLILSAEALAWEMGLRVVGMVAKPIISKVFKGLFGNSGKNLSPVAKDAVRAYEEGALNVPEGKMFKQAHKDAPLVREALGMPTSKNPSIGLSNFESAHVIPQDVGKHLAHYKPGKALTFNLPESVHRAWDQIWKKEWTKLQSSGKAVTAKDVQLMLENALSAVPEATMTQATKTSIKNQISDELYQGLGLVPDSIVIQAKKQVPMKINLLR